MTMDGSVSFNRWRVRRGVLHLSAGEVRNGEFCIFQQIAMVDGGEGHDGVGRQQSGKGDDVVATGRTSRQRLGQCHREQLSSARLL